MKKRIVLIAGLFILMAQTLPAAVTFPNVLTPIAKIDIGYGVKITAERLLTLTPKEYRELTGHNLGLFKSIALKFVQKKAGKEMKKSEEGNKSKVTAALLAFFLGGLGIHRFYLGYTWQGVVQLLTAGGLGIWALIDFIRILTGSLQPKNGIYK